MCFLSVLGGLVGLCRLLPTWRAHRACRAVTVPRASIAAVLLVLAIHFDGLGRSMGQEADYASVSSPGELQDAVNRGVRHIIVTAHLDMASTPLSQDSRTQEDFVLSIVQALEGGYTRSIRVRWAV